MGETRKLAAILVSDVVGYSRLAGTDEDRTLSRLRALRSDLIDPTIAVHHGRIVKRTGDGSLIEFRSVVDAVRCAIDVQTGLIERNTGLPPEKRIEFRVGIHLGDVVEESDGDLMSRLDLRVTDLGQTQLKNIAEPIRVYSLNVGQADNEKPAAASTREKSPRPRRSIVILPLANIGGDPELEHFVDGVTESLTTDLSRRRRAVVTARNTAFAYKEKNIDVKTIGRDLNVYYVLEGSVQRSGNRVRTNVQLIDADTGNHLWADRFDKPAADLFDMQDEIVARVAGSLTDQLGFAEARRAEQAPNPDSMDLYFQGLVWFNKGPTPDNVVKARDFFDRALASDQEHVDALVWSAIVDTIEAAPLFVKEPVAAMAAAEAKLMRALSLAPDHARTHATLGRIYMLTNRATQGVAECERALTLDPNLAEARAWIGAAKTLVGHGEAAETHILDALRLSPRDTQTHRWMHLAGHAKLHIGVYEEAVAWFRRSIEVNRNYAPSHLELAAALAHLGRADEARATANAGLTLAPSFSIARLHAGYSAFSDNPTFLTELRDEVVEGMRKAGLPE
jgi:TolB-like protein